MAKVLESYELHQVCGKIVLLAMHPPSYRKREPRMRLSFFVLKKGETFILCWEKNAELQTMTCNEFQISHGLLLLKWDKENWYWWKKDDFDKKPCLLGKKVSKYGPAFIGGTGNSFEFAYFPPDGKLEKKPCLDYERLEERIVFSSDGYSGNILRLETKEEGSLFVRIKKVPRRLFHKYRTVPERYYDFVFVPAESSAE